MKVFGQGLGNEIWSAALLFTACQAVCDKVEDAGRHAEETRLLWRLCLAPHRRNLRNFLHRQSADNMHC